MWFQKTRKEKVASTFKNGFRVNAHRAGWELIRMPVDMVRRCRKKGDDPAELKDLSFDELLARWEIPREKVPRREGFFS